MTDLKKAFSNLDLSYSQGAQKAMISFAQFLNECVGAPQIYLRNVFQVFQNMIWAYVGNSSDLWTDDSGTPYYPWYDFSRIFVEGRNHPFYADMVFGQRLIKWAESFTQDAFQNKVFIFRGPPGSGKSTFLNNLLAVFEEYANSEEGLRYEVVWRLATDDVIAADKNDEQSLDNLKRLLTSTSYQHQKSDIDLDTLETTNFQGNGFIDIPCPNHDHPILIIPKLIRSQFLDDLFRNDAVKYDLFNDKQYDWVFNDLPCTICTAIYAALHKRLGSHTKILDQLYARPFEFNRRLGQGISLYHPGDKPLRNEIITNELLQKNINRILRDSRSVHYIYSAYASSNNGIYALMDMKSRNIERLMGLRNIISEGTHKIEDVEEKVNSLFLAVMNSDDVFMEKEERAFQYRIEYIDIPYIIDINTEVEIYRSMRGRRIDDDFLPRVLHNFARVIISSRLNPKPGILQEWIENPSRYYQYCDENLLILKMELCAMHVPNWLSDEDRAKLQPDLIRRIIDEAVAEEEPGISVRDSVNLFNLFYDTYVSKYNILNMYDLASFFRNIPKHFQQVCALIPNGFLEALQRFYDFSVVNELKDAFYYFDEQQADQNIKNYIAGVCRSFDDAQAYPLSDEGINITEDFLQEMEWRLLGSDAGDSKRISFRNCVWTEVQCRTKSDKITIQQSAIEQTRLYKALYERYEYYSRENVLAPILENQTFINAITDYGEENFKQYDKWIRDNVSYLINNLTNTYRYTEGTAKAIAKYILEYKLAQNWLP